MPECILNENNNLEKNNSFKDPKSSYLFTNCNKFIKITKNNVIYIYNS